MNSSCRLFSHDYPSLQRSQNGEPPIIAMLILKWSRPSYFDLHFQLRFVVGKIHIVDSPPSFNEPFSRVFFASTHQDVGPQLRRPQSMICNMSISGSGGASSAADKLPCADLMYLRPIHHHFSTSFVFICWRGRINMMWFQDRRILIRSFRPGKT